MPKPLTRFSLLTALCLCISVMIGFGSLLASAQSITSTTDMAKQILQWTNEERAKVHASPLTWDGHLAVAAQLHSNEMAKQSALSHQFQDEPTLSQRLSERGARFSAAAENVGFAGTAEELQSGWMHSPPHRANLLNPRYDHVGIAITRVGDRLWATEDFTTAVNRLSPDEFEKAVADQITKRRQTRHLGPLHMTSSPGLRKLACSGDPSAGTAFAAVPHQNVQMFAFNFTGSSPDQLPADLMRRILELPSGAYYIGACAQSDPGTGFSAYRVLIVLHQ
ncbi:MAG TPA: CAP domain-containing protein [Terriglobales bacterium]|nr:CAP domain-containing protein [Terriglobales bacterium]